MEVKRGRGRTGINDTTAATGGPSGATRRTRRGLGGRLASGRLTSRIRGGGAGEDARVGEEEAGPDEEEAGPTEVEVLSLRGLRECFAVSPPPEEETFRFGAMMRKRARKKTTKEKGAERRNSELEGASLQGVKEVRTKKKGGRGYYLVKGQLEIIVTDMCFFFLCFKRSRGVRGAAGVAGKSSALRP